MKIKASIKNFRSAPRKTRLVANFIRGKDAKKATKELSFLNKKVSFEIIKLINSAIANAENNFSLNSDNLYIDSIRVDEGKVLKRHRAGSNGRALPFKRRLSWVSLILAEKKINKK